MNPSPPVLIEGVRLRLRRSTPEDAASTFHAAAHAEVMRYMDWPAHRCVSDAQAYLLGCQARWEAGAEYHWVIVDKRSPAVIGSIACRVSGYAADFGYLLAHDAWGQGLGTEAGVLRMATWRPQLVGPPRDTAVFAWVRERS